MSFLDIITVEEKEEKNKVIGSNCSSFVFNGFPNTLGTTFGNFLRRLAIINLAGVALCGVKIKDKNGDVKTKFSSITGTDKVSFTLVLALKEIVFEERKEILVGDFFFFNLEFDTADEEAVIKAGDFIGKNINGEDSDDIIIKNPDLFICVLAPNSHLEIKLFCRKNVGYFPERKQEKTINKKFEEDKFIIVLDTDYCPIKGDDIFPRVEKVVTSLIDEEERLTLDIKTNGSITPQKALKETLVLASKMFEDIEGKVRKNIK